MTKYLLTFRIHDETVAGLQPYERRNALYGIVDEMSSQWWLEPTSFMLFESENDIDALAGACKAAIAPSVDLVLIRKLDAGTARVMGKIDDPTTLAQMMPYVSRV